MVTMPADAPLQLHTDRLLPTDPGVRSLAQRLHEAVRDLPITSPHGHVDPRLLLDDEPFSDPASLLVTPDHYITRLLHASGVPLPALGVGRGRLEEHEARQVWRRLCEHWPVLSGTPVRSWLESTLVELFGVTVRPSSATADRVYDQVAARLASDDCRPRALFSRFGVAVLATTDDPCDDLSVHAALAQDDGFPGRVLPTFRPDAYLEPALPDWPASVRRLGDVADEDTTTYSGWTRAMERRREHFATHGATATDHSHEDVRTDPLDPRDADRLYQDALRGRSDAAGAAALRRHMLLEMARMSTEDGLVMMLHPAVRRGHHGPTTRQHGPDTGHDIPLAVEFTDALRPLLERFGTSPKLHLVVFTLDESTLTRELAPLAGFYPSVYVGAPWWFLDAPDAVRRFRRAVTETVGFTRTSGFVDDTRAFCSLPARHDMARRLDAGYLAQLVAEHRLEEDEAHEIAVELVGALPTQVFKL